MDKLEKEIIFTVPCKDLDASSMASVTLGIMDDILKEVGDVFKGSLRDEETRGHTRAVLAQLFEQLVQDNPEAVIRGAKLIAEDSPGLAGLETAAVEIIPFDQTGHRLVAADEEFDYPPTLTVLPAKSTEPRMLIGCKRIPGTGGHTVTVLSQQLTGGILKIGEPVPNRIKTPLKRTDRPLLVCGDSVEITSIPVFDRTRLIQPTWRHSNMGLLNSHFEHPEPFQDEIFLSRVLTEHAVNNLLRARRIAELSGEPMQG